MDADGTNVRQLTHNSGGDGASGWSPDGSQILFDSSRYGDREIFAMDADGANVRQLTHNDHDDWVAVWGVGADIGAPAEHAADESPRGLEDLTGSVLTYST